MVREKLVLDKARLDSLQLLEQMKIFSMSSKMLELSIQPVLCLYDKNVNFYSIRSNAPWDRIMLRLKKQYKFEVSPLYLIKGTGKACA